MLFDVPTGTLKMFKIFSQQLALFCLYIDLCLNNQDVKMGLCFVVTCWERVDLLALLCGV